MIALLTGQIVSKSPNEVIIDVGGVGYHVHTTLNAFDKLPEAGQPVTFQIFTHVREDTLALYGFLSLEEKALFTKLLKVSGVGPKLADLLIKSGWNDLNKIASAKTDNLTTVHSVGEKKAQKIISAAKKFLEEQEQKK